MSGTQNLTRNLMFGAYSGAVATIAAVIGHKLVDSTWKSVTGEDPPDPNDPSVPPGRAFAWVMANALGIGVLGVAANRFAASRWLKFAKDLPQTRPVNVKL